MHVCILNNSQDIETKLEVYLSGAFVDIRFHLKSNSTDLANAVYNVYNALIMGL